MEIEIYVKSSHWMDRAPNSELRKLENIERLFKVGQIEKPILTAYIKSSDVKVLDSPAQKLTRVGNLNYLVKGRIIAGYATNVVVDCGVLLRVSIEDVTMLSLLHLHFDDYIEFKTKIFGFYYDLWEGLIHYKTPFEGRVKKASRVEDTNDISLQLEVVKPGSDIVISPPYKPDTSPDKNWNYLFGKRSNEK